MHCSLIPASASSRIVARNKYMLYGKDSRSTKYTGTLFTLEIFAGIAGSAVYILARVTSPMVVCAFPFTKAAAVQGFIAGIVIGQTSEEMLIDSCQACEQAQVVTHARVNKGNVCRHRGREENECMHGMYLLYHRRVGLIQHSSSPWTLITKFPICQAR